MSVSNFRHNLTLATETSCDSISSSADDLSTRPAREKMWTSAPRQDDLRCSPPRLLVSVRSPAEALAAISGGADIIDVKEPAQGPLGRASGATVAAIQQTVKGKLAPLMSLSAALGELGELPEHGDWESIPPLVGWVKVGLSGLSGTDWRASWMSRQQRLRELSPGTQLIAVVYADWQQCGAPSPNEIVDFACATQTPGVLVDTFFKQGRTLLDELPLEALNRALQPLRSCQRFTALAGSVAERHLPELMHAQPDVIAVRSAVCAGGRQGTVCSDHVRAFQSAMQQAFKRHRDDVLKGENPSGS